MYATKRCQTVLVLLLAALAACSETTTPSAEEVASIAVEPSTPTLRLGDQVKLDAVVRSSTGQVLANRQVFWSVENSAVAQVSADGTLTGVGVGVTRVAASAGGKDTIAEVRVQPRPVGSVLLAPDSLRLAVGSGAAFQATLRDDRGEPVTQREIRWTSSAPTIASVDGSGTVLGLQPGTAQITAESEGASASRPVRVVAGAAARLDIVGGNDQQARVGAELPQPLRVRVLDANGNPVAGVRVTWQVESGGGSVSPASTDTDAGGNASARWQMGVRPGTYTVQAQVAGVGSVTFTARAVVGPVAWISVEPKSASLSAIGDAVDFSASITDAFGNTLTGVNVTWTSLNTTVAIVDQSGRVWSRANGTASIVASVDGLADTAAVQVQQVIDRVTVSPQTATLDRVGSTVQLVATAQDRNGNHVPSASFAWSSLDPAVASVSGSGLVTALASGTARIRVSAGGREAIATITVVEPPRPSVIRIVSGNQQVGTRGTRLSNPLVVEVTDDQGRPVAGAVVLWDADRGGTISPSTAITDASGRVAVWWTLGQPRGLQQATATLQANGATVTFQAVSQ